MYQSLNRWRGQSHATGTLARQIAAGFHVGTYRDYLRWHVSQTARMVKCPKNERREYLTSLLDRVRDERNLRSSIDHIDQNGGTAPGPDGIHLTDLDDRDRWTLARELRDELHARIYHPGGHREVRIAKGPGRGHRTIQIQNLRDRVIQRAIVQIISPYLDPQFSDRSFGFRPKKGREHAMACASALAGRNGTWVVVTEDVKDAFNQVPLQRLMDIVTMRFPSSGGLLELIKTVIGGHGPRGLRQGGSLSPILLNVYLDHFLDRPWATRYPEWPLIRVADDLLILTRSDEEAHRAREALEHLLRPAGMPLKGTSETAICDLSAGETTRWLGYDLIRQGDEIQAHLSAKSPLWDKLAKSLTSTHESEQAPQRAWDILIGWVATQGASYHHTDRKACYTRIQGIAAEAAIEEIPSQDELEVLWTEAYQRWETIRKQARQAVREGTGTRRLRLPLSIAGPDSNTDHREMGQTQGPAQNPTETETQTEAQPQHDTPDLHEEDLARSASRYRPVRSGDPASSRDAHAGMRRRHPVRGRVLGDLWHHQRQKPCHPRPTWAGTRARPPPCESLTRNVASWPSVMR